MKKDAIAMRLPADRSGARVDGPLRVPTPKDVDPAPAVLSEEAVDAVLESAGIHRMQREREHLNRMLHDAAVEAARDGACTPIEEREQVGPRFLWG